MKVVLLKEQTFYYQECRREEMTKRIQQLLDEAQEEFDNENYIDVKESLETALELILKMI